MKVTSYSHLRCISKLRSFGDFTHPLPLGALLSFFQHCINIQLFFDHAVMCHKFMTERQSLSVFRFLRMWESPWAVSSVMRERATLVSLPR